MITISNRDMFANLIDYGCIDYIQRYFIVAWIIAMLLFTYLSNVRIFIRRMKITFGRPV